MGVTRTIRLASDDDLKLQALAKQEKVSVNFLINRSLRKLIEWDAYVDKFGVVSISEATLMKLMEHLTDQDAEQLGRQVANAQGKLLVQYMWGEISLDSILNSFRITSRYTGLFDFDHTVDRNRHVMILKHSMGLRWSLYYQAMVHSIFKDLLNMQVKTEVTNDMLLATF